MGLQLQMLGTGSAFAKKNYNNNALLLGDDFTLMIDCGITAPTSLYQLGKKFRRYRRLPDYTYSRGPRGRT